MFSLLANYSVCPKGLAAVRWDAFPTGQRTPSYVFISCQTVKLSLKGDKSGYRHEASAGRMGELSDPDTRYAYVQNKPKMYRGES